MPEDTSNLSTGKELKKRRKKTWISEFLKQKALTYAQMQQHLFKYMDDACLAYEMLCKQS